MYVPYTSLETPLTMRPPMSKLLCSAYELLPFNDMMSWK
jgi:hypothetical protein